MNAAREHLEQAIEINPEYAEAYYELGLLEKGEGNAEGAWEHFQKAVSLNSNYAEAQCELLSHSRPKVNTKRQEAITLMLLKSIRTMPTLILIMLFFWSI